MTDWLRSTPERPRARLLLAHGAGAPMDSDFMNAMAEGLCAAGVDVWRFEFAYMAERRASGKRRPPPRAERLESEWRAALKAVPGDALPLFVGGKSLGGRVAALVANAPPVAGLVCLGYPFHPPGKPERTRLEPLRALRVPALMVQGSRDPLGDRDQVRGYDLPAGLEWHWLEDGDHDFKPRVRSGYRRDQHWQSAVERVAGWLIGQGARS